MSHEPPSSFPGASGMLARYPGHKLYYADEYPRGTFGNLVLPPEIYGRVRSQRVLQYPVGHYFPPYSPLILTIREQGFNTLADLMLIQIENLSQILNYSRYFKRLERHTVIAINMGVLFGPEDRFMRALFPEGEGKNLIKPEFEPKRADAIKEAMDNLPLKDERAEIRRKHIDLFFGFTTGEPENIGSISKISKRIKKRIKRDIDDILERVRASQKGDLLRTYLSAELRN